MNNEIISILFYRTIKVVAAINNRICAVYYSTDKCYQFSIVDEYGCYFDCSKIYYKE